jgi:hypothetical protein
MKITQAFNTNKIHDTKINSWEPPFNEIESNLTKMIDQILEDRNIADSEKDLIRQLLNPTMENLDPLSVDWEAQSEQERIRFLSLINPLIASCDTSHPYLYYYHFLKGTVIVLNVNEAIANGFGSTTEFKPEIDIVLQDLTESIRLNPEFGDAYYMRGIIHACLGDDEMGTEDIAAAARLGSKDAQDFLELFKETIRA